MRTYAALRDRLLVVTAAGRLGVGDASPLVRTRLEGTSLETVAAHHSAPDRAFVGTADRGCLVTRDGGDSFEPVDDVAEDTVTAVGVSHRDHDEVWLGTEPSRCYRSTDGGRRFDRLDGLRSVPSADEWSFPPRPDTHHVRCIEPDPTDTDRCYLGIEAGALCYTPDGGETWRDRPPGARRDNHDLASHPDAPGRVYAAAGDGYAVSTDGGEHWTSPRDGLDHGYVWSVCPDPGDPDRVLVTAASGPRTAHRPPGESYLYRREGDAPWDRLEGPLGGEGVLRGVLATDGRPERVVGLTNRGLYTSSDFGDTWSQVGLRWPDALREQAPRGLAVVPTD